MTYLSNCVVPNKRARNDVESAELVELNGIVEYFLVNSKNDIFPVPKLGLGSPLLFI